MGLKYYEQYATEQAQSPHEMYTELAQAFLDEEWENGAAKTPENGGRILEQQGIGSEEYKCIEAWVKNTVGDVTSGTKDSRDFMKLFFRDIKHTCIRGQFYQFQKSYWIVNDYNHFDGIAQSTCIRRCNNWLRMIDPEDGGVFAIPCVVDYDMSSPSLQVSRYVITPNNHATVITQANTDTLRLFKTNTRFILDGRPFKITGFQNALQYDIEEQVPTIFYIDLYLDEIHAKDDLEKGIADNGDYVYTISIDQKDMELTTGSTGQLSATVFACGQIVDNNVIWLSNAPKIVSIDKQGKYTALGTNGQNALITAKIEGNESASDSITITIGARQDVEPVIKLSASVETVRQFEEIPFSVEVLYNNKVYSDFDTLDVSLADNADGYVSLSQNEKVFILTGLKLTKEPVAMTVSAKTAEFDVSEDYNIAVVSMMG